MGPLCRSLTSVAPAKARGILPLGFIAGSRVLRC